MSIEQKKQWIPNKQSMGQSPDSDFEWVKSGTKVYKLYDSIHRHLRDRQLLSVVTDTVMVVDNQRTVWLGRAKAFLCW